MSRQAWTVVGGLLATLALGPSATVAQDVSATVSGTVKDQQGGVVPGAAVVLISEARGTEVARAVTDAIGDFVLANVLADTYTLQVTLQGFKTLRQTGVIVSPGDRLRLPAVVLEVGTLTETVEIAGETPLLQAASGERSYTIPTTSVDNLPISSRNFRDLALAAPGVTTGGMLGVTRIGSAGYGVVLMDGITAMDTGNNGQMLAMNTEAIAEVKVLVSEYQAEYGRNGGIQVLSVTRSGTNTFRGSLYDVKRNSAWNANTWYNEQMGYPKAVSKQDDWGYTIGGPVGKPGGRNRLFFFYAHEFRPRTGGNVAQNFRVPTELERQGNFSQSRDNYGRLYPYIKDAQSPYACSATNTAGCFQYQGVVGWIPPDRLYAPGIALLNMYPIKPNVAQVEGMAYNVHQFSPVIKTLEYQPAVRVDYQMTSALRVAFKYNGHNRNSGLPKQYGPIGAGTTASYAIPDLNDSLGNQKPWVYALSVSANYNLGSKTFLEAIWGMTKNAYCTVNTAPLSNRYTAKLDGIPDIYTTNREVNPDYFVYKALSGVVAPFFVNGRIELPQQVSFGTRTSSAVGTPPFPSFLNVNKNWDFAASATHVRGRHTLKGGVSLNHSFKAQNLLGAGNPMGVINFGETTNNPYDTGFGFANLAIGTFQTYSQASKFIEAGMVLLGIEPYIQDNWMVNNRLTLDYGLRFVHLIPEHDKYTQASNFFPDQWSAANAPALYVPGCPGGAYPCQYTRQAMNPLTGQLMGSGTAGLIGQRIPGTGSLVNGIKQQGQGISKYNFEYPFLEVGPRAGFAYLLKPDGKWILRGSFGLFYDRVEGNFTMGQSTNPPTAESTTMYYGTLQTLGQGVASGSVPALNTYRYANSSLPTSATWNIGTQLQLPYAFALDAAYVGQYSYDTMGSQGWTDPTNLNQVDLGAAYLVANQDPTLNPSTVPGQNALTTNLLRYYKGYGSIQEVRAIFHRTGHSLQFSLQRRFNRGFSTGLNWNWVLYDKGNHGLVPRMEHVNGQLQNTSDWQQYQDLNADRGTPTHLLRANFVWDLPDLRAGSGVAMTIVRNIINDWRLSGMWAGQTGAGYSISYYYYSNGTNVNLTGSPDYAASIRIVGDPGSGCSSNRYQQFNAAAFAGPTYYSDGLESGSNYLHACSTSIWDLAITRVIRLGGSRTVQLTGQLYNVLNSAFWTSRNTTVYYTSPTDQTVRNAQYLADGTLDPARAKPDNPGFGVANGATSPRTMQLLIRFSF